MAEARVRFGFRNASDQQIAAIAAAVLEGVIRQQGAPQSTRGYDDPPDGNEPVKDAIASREQGGRTASAQKNKIRGKIDSALTEVSPSRRVEL